MKIKNIVLNSIKRFNSSICLNFDGAKRINTISGRNGSGKTTIFESVMLIQKAYFAKRMMNNLMNTYKDIVLEDMIGKEFFDFIRSEESSIVTELQFEKEDFSNLSSHKIQRLLQNSEFGTEIPEYFDIKLTLFVQEVLTENVKWNIKTENFIQEEVLNSFWDLDQPKSIIAYISADKTVGERDITFQEVKLDGKNEFSPIVDFVLEPEKIYYNLYSLMINDHIYQRIIPLTPKKNKYFDEAKKLLNELIPYIKVSNFSGKVRENQFILLANSDGNGKNFDVRKFSSGEKLVWYSFLLLAYIEDMGILVIDEPENHLHEELTCRFTKLLGDISSSKIDFTNLRLGQTYLITHSKTLIYNNFGNGENYVLGKRSIDKIEYESCEKTLRSLGLSYTNDKILFVEGNTEVTLLQNLLAEENIKVRELGNCAEIIRTFNGLVKVKKYLLDPRFVFLIDRDTRDEKSIKEMRNRDVDYFDRHFIVLEKHEIENYFLDFNIIKEVCDEFTNFFGINEISINEIEDRVRSIADEQLQYTKKKYMNSLLRNKLSTIESFIKQKDLKVDNLKNHERYIKNLFNGNNWNNVLADLINVFNYMEETYAEENWETSWLELLDGKNVFNITMGMLAKKLGVSKDKFEKKVLENIASNNDTDFMRLINKIIELFNDN
ncbi:AAA family ATPase [Bacillus haynesii]|uniref:AAA family ATPase n=1 Tax=Bacillus haynesii TaxID=1925021 RepID=UPI002281B10A|nr:AAA family ATPase [Bacillus haynesii]MCY7752003.1 AAA family ATPase [Bacillus haynesii]